MNKPTKSRLHPDRSPIDAMLFGASFGMNEWKHQINVCQLEIGSHSEINIALSNDHPAISSISDVRHFPRL